MSIIPPDPNPNEPALTASTSAAFAMACAGFQNVYVYAYRDNRWWFIADGVEYWLIDDELGARVVENCF